MDPNPHEPPETETFMHHRDGVRTLARETFGCVGVGVGFLIGAVVGWAVFGPLGLWPSDSRWATAVGVLVAFAAAGTGTLGALIGDLWAARRSRRVGKDSTANVR
jgi:hypothetical protein